MTDMLRNPLAVLLEAQLKRLPRAPLDAPDPLALRDGEEALDAQRKALHALLTRLQAELGGDATPVGDVGPRAWARAQDRAVVDAAVRTLRSLDADDARWAEAVRQSAAALEASARAGKEFWTGYWNANRVWTRVPVVHEMLARDEVRLPYAHAKALADVLTRHGWTVRVAQESILCAEMLNSGTAGTGVGASPFCEVKTSHQDRYVTLVRNPDSPAQP